MRDAKDSMFKRNVNINQNRTVEPAARQAESYASKNHSGNSHSKTGHVKNSGMKNSHAKSSSAGRGMNSANSKTPGKKRTPGKKGSFGKTSNNRRNNLDRNPYTGNPQRAGVSREEERRAHRDERRRQQKIRRKIFYAVMIFVVIIIGVVLSLTVFFNIATIEVKGESIYSTEEIISASGIKVGDNLFLLKKSDVQTNVCEKLPFIGSVTVKNSLPSKVVLTVKQTSIKCAVESDGGYIMLDETGKVLCKVTTLEEVYEGAGVIPPENLTKSNDNLQQASAGDSQQSQTAGTTDTTDATPQATATTNGTTKSTTGSTTQATTDSAAKSANNNSQNSTTAGTTQTPTSAETQPAAENNSEKKPQYVLLTDKIIILKGIEVKSAEPGKKLDVKNKKSFDLYGQIMKSFEKEGIDGITSMDLSNTVEIKLIYQDRITIEVGTVANLEKKMALAANVIKSQDEISPYQEGTINLTIDKQAYFSPKPEESTTEPQTQNGDQQSQNGNQQSQSSDQQSQSNN